MLNNSFTFHNTQFTKKLYLCKSLTRKTKMNTKHLLMVIIVFLTPRLAAQSDSGSDTAAFFFSKKQIVEKLKRLKETPPPPKKSWRVMINYVWPISNTVEYVCSICSKKTFYSCGNSGENWLYVREDNRDNPYVREVSEKQFRYIRQGLRCTGHEYEIQKIKGINVSLDRSELCMHCFPSIKKPTLYLLVNINGETDTIRTPNVSYEDIRLLQELLNDSLVRKEIGSETPLVKYIKRLKELLGIKEEIK